MRNKKLIRIIAIVLAVLLAGGVVFGALFSSLAEQQTAVGNAGRHQCELTMEYLADEQALHITQRLVYCNHSGRRLTEVVFYAAGNLFRRENAQMYGADDLERVFFAGYTPAGIDLRAVRCDEKPTDFGFQGEDENYLRVSCDVAPGGQCTFEFDYYLLLMRCGAFQGVGDTDVRLSAFCFVPGVYDAGTGQFDMKTPLAHARWLDCEAGDYRATLTLPEGWVLCATGERQPGFRGRRTRTVWRMEADGVREFALSFGRRWREASRQTASGRSRSDADQRARRGGARVGCRRGSHRPMRGMVRRLPCRMTLELAQSDAPLDAMVFPGVVWLPSELLAAGEADDLAQRIRFAVAQQYLRPVGLGGALGGRLAERFGVRIRRLPAAGGRVGAGALPGLRQPGLGQRAAADGARGPAHYQRRRAVRRRHLRIGGAAARARWCCTSCAWPWAWRTSLPA